MGKQTSSAPPPATSTDSAIEPPNLAVIVGELVTDPISRTLPGGAVAMSFSLTVRSPGRATTSVPLVWYDPPARVTSWAPPRQILAIGSVVRRFYQSGGRTGSTTEGPKRCSNQRPPVISCRSSIP